MTLVHGGEDAAGLRRDAGGRRGRRGCGGSSPGCGGPAGRRRRRRAGRSATRRCRTAGPLSWLDGTTLRRRLFEAVAFHPQRVEDVPGGLRGALAAPAEHDVLDPLLDQLEREVARIVLPAGAAVDD